MIFLISVMGFWFLASSTWEKAKKGGLLGNVGRSGGMGGGLFLSFLQRLEHLEKFLYGGVA